MTVHSAVSPPGSTLFAELLELDDFLRVLLLVLLPAGLEEGDRRKIGAGEIECDGEKGRR